MKTVYLLIGGITDKNYIFDDFVNAYNLKDHKRKDWRILKAIKNTAVRDFVISEGADPDNSKCPAIIEEINCEKLFDASKWLKSEGFSDRMGDAINFYLKPSTRKEARALVKEQIEIYQSRGFRIVVFAHSLGTTILAGTDVKVDEAYLFGSPIGFFSPLLRELVRRELRLFWGYFGRWAKLDRLQAKKLNYYWSDQDIVSKVEPDIRLIESFVSQDGSFSVKKVDAEHDFKQYLEEFKKEYKLLI